MPTQNLPLLQPEDLFKIKSLQCAVLSPDGRSVVYAVSHIAQDGDDEAEYVTLWLMPLEGGAARPLTAGRAYDSSPCWSPDGRHIAFLSNRGGTTQVYTMPIDGGEARAITALPRGVGGAPAWSPDGEWIAFSAGPQTAPPDPAAPYRLTRRVMRYDGMGYLDQAVHALYVVPTNGGEPKRLTDDACHNTGPIWSPDSSALLCSVSMWPDFAFPDLAALRVVMLDGTVRELIAGWGYATSAVWLEGGARIAFVGAPHGVVVDTRYDLYTLDVEGGTPHCHTASLKYGVGGWVGSDLPAMRDVRGQPTILFAADGASALVPVHIGGAIEIHRVTVNGPEASAPVVGGPRTCYLLDGNQHHILYAALTMHSPPELFTADRAGSNERQLTRLNEALLAERAEARVQHLQFSGTDGVPVEGWLLLPPHGEPPYPTVLHSHGGPNGAYGHAYMFEFNMLAAAGYAVLFVNFRGSTGYGVDFATEMLADWGNLDYGDSMAGVDAAIAAGLADPDRLACMGLSYGGFMTTWIVGQTRRFKAAIAEAAITNLVSVYGAADIPGWMEAALGGPPNELPELYRRISPLTYAHTCTTPTLLMVGEHDFRCPAEQTEQFYAALKAVGCPTEMVRYPNSPHAGSINGPLAVRRAHGKAVLDWLGRYMPV